MVVPVIKEPVKNKELLIEVDSIVTDPKDLANVSLSSNDSLSKSRRKWRLIKIINKLNPAFAERKYQFPVFKFFLAWLFIVLICLIIYWSVAPRTMVNSEPDCASPKSLKSTSVTTPNTLDSVPTPKTTPYVPMFSSLLPKLPFIPLLASSMKETPKIEPPKIETSDDLDWSNPFPDFEIPIVPYEDTYDDMLDSRESLFPLEEDPETNGITIDLSDSLSDLSDSFSLRSSDISPDLVLASVDKFINFFKSMINF